MKLNKSQLQGLIEPFLLEQVKEQILTSESTDPKALLKYTRFDLAFKLIYLKLKDRCPNYARTIYKEHIRAFSLGEFTEPGNPKKNSIKKFFSEFSKIYDSMTLSGFDPNKSLVPVSTSGTIINGAHRVASAIHLDKEITCLELAETSVPNYDYQFFRNRKVPEQYLDAAATTFVEFSTSTYIAFIWPAAQGKEKELEASIPNVVYKKNIHLNRLGAHNILSQIYQGESWLGTPANNFRGVAAKLTECFKTFDSVRVYAFQANDLNAVIDIKNKIRNIYCIGKHSVHITDTHEEAILAARMVFNNNCLNFLNNAKPNRYLDFHIQMNSLSSLLCDNGTFKDNIILSEKATLSIYGISNYKTIDYYDQSCIKINSSYNKTYFQKDKCIIYDQSNYFYFNDFKFLSLDLSYFFLKEKEYDKNIDNYQIIEDIINNKRRVTTKEKLSILIGYEIIRIKSMILALLQRLGLYASVRLLYRKIKKQL